MLSIRHKLMIIMSPLWHTFICFMSFKKHPWVKRQAKVIFHLAMLCRDLFSSLAFLRKACVGQKRVSTLIWQAPRHSRCFESRDTRHKSNEEHVHRQTKCHQSDRLPGSRSKTETSRNLTHICFLWRQRTKVMKSLTREGERERNKSQGGFNKRAIDNPSFIWGLALKNKR